MNEYERDYSKINSENFTQKDLMQYLLHSTQHVATREELQGVKSDLRNEIQDVKTELKRDMQELKTELKSDMQELKSELKTDSNKLDSKIDRLQWFLIAGFLTILLKDYLF